MTARRILTGLIVWGCLVWARPAAADVVTDWNKIALQAVGAAGVARPGPSGLIDVAMVHVAIHDAVQAYQARFKSYAGPISNASGSPVAAVAAAARDVLVGVGLVSTPAGTVDSIYTKYLDDRSLTGNPGVAVGQEAAARILELRAGKNGGIPPGAEAFFGGNGPGEWRPTSFNAAGQPIPMAAAYLATLTPFTLDRPSQFREGGPPRLAGPEYARDYNEVKSLGGLVDSGRTPEQTDTALFFADNAIAYWNRTLQAIADEHLVDIGNSARMFALVNMAMADALITSWDSKRYWNLWRPVTAIRSGNADGNSRTTGDATWQSYVATPNYPDYTSGANNLSGAATTMLKNFFRTDKMWFTMTSNFVHPTTLERPQSPRLYERFSDAADDVVDARIYEGIHFRFADTEGRQQGRRVADWAFKRFLEPLHGSDN